MADILVVDDDENICSAFRQFLEADGHSAIIASNAEDALNAVKERHPDLVFLDVRMPGVNGLEALKQMRALEPNIQAVIMTAYSTSQTSIEAVRLGAFDYLNKPLDLDDVRNVIDKALAAQVLSRKASEKKPDEWERYSLVNLVGSSQRMQAVYKLIGLLTTNDVPVLILGERGSGKQLVAQTIHFNSGRKDRPFVTVDCQNVQAETAEVEIFGRSAAGAAPAYAGCLQKANGGTLFINEIRYLTPVAQIKLLRFLKEKAYEQIGATSALTADVRVLAGSSQALTDHTTQGFNVELYEFLKLITIELPPLRDRPDDIPELVNHFIRRHNSELHKNIKGVDDSALEILRDRGWPGNVGELENVTKRASILARGDVLTLDDIRNALERNVTPMMAEAWGALQATTREALHQRLLVSNLKRASSVFYDIVSEVENSLVSEALRITDGNQVKAAELLGLNRATLRKKMKFERSET